MKEMLDLIQQYSGALSTIATIILVGITAYYAYLTRGILSATANQSRLSLAPVVGITVRDIYLGAVYGDRRRNMSVSLDLSNIGNAPAIEVYVDGEIELRYSKIKNEKYIPQRFGPFLIPFVRPGETTSEASLTFGNTVIDRFLDDARESKRLNQERIKSDPSRKAYLTSRLRIIVTCKNSLGQYFKSTYESEIGFFRKAIPADNEECNVDEIPIYHPDFHAETCSESMITEELAERDRNRKLSGW